jgi:hypothetical protein
VHDFKKFICPKERTQPAMQMEIGIPQSIEDMPRKHLCGLYPDTTLHMNLFNTAHAPSTGHNKAMHQSALSIFMRPA